MKTTVIGAGVTGLTTAIALAEAGIETSIVAAELPQATTSAAAGAVWYPYGVGADDASYRWCHRTWERFSALAQDRSTGVMETEIIEILPGATEHPWWARVLPTFEDAEYQGRPAWRFGSVVIRVPDYLDYLSARAGRLEIAVERRTIDSFGETGSQLEVNCSGIGARDLAGDTSLEPVRGQVIRIANPGLTECIIDDYGKSDITYVFPRGPDCILGGSRQAGDWNRAEDVEMTESIMRRARQLVPAIGENPQLLDVRVGLRPERPSVRLEVEAIRDTMVIHNYGHGGSGYSLSWGCAEDVVAAATSLA